MPRDSRRRDDDDFEDRPRQRRRDPDDTNPWIIWGPVAGILVIGLVLAAFLIGRSKRTADTPTEVVDNKPKQNEQQPIDQPRKKDNSNNEPTGKKNVIAPKVVVEPNDPAIVQRFASTVRLETTATGVERLVVADPPAQRIGVHVSDYSGGKHRQFFDAHDIKTDKRLGRIDIPDRTYHGMSFSPDGKLLLGFANAATEFRNTIDIWQIDGSKHLVTNWQPFPDADLSNSAAWSDFVANDRIVVLGRNRLIQVFSVPEMKLVGGCKIFTDGLYDVGGQDPYSKMTYEAALTPDRQLLAVWNRDGFNFIDTKTGKDLGRTKSLADIAGKYSTDVIGTAYTPDGAKFVAWISSNDSGKYRHHLLTFDAASRERIQTVPLKTEDLPGHFIWFWGPNHIFLHHGSIGQAFLHRVEDGRIIRDVLYPKFGKYGFSRDGSLWYLGSESVQTSAYVHRLDFPERLQMEKGVPTGQLIPRLWLTSRGVSYREEGRETRVGLGERMSR